MDLAKNNLEDHSILFIDASINSATLHGQIFTQSQGSVVFLLRNERAPKLPKPVSGTKTKISLKLFFAVVFNSRNLNGLNSFLTLRPRPFSKSSFLISRNQNELIGFHLMHTNDKAWHNCECYVTN